MVLRWRVAAVGALVALSAAASPTAGRAGDDQPAAKTDQDLAAVGFEMTRDTRAASCSVDMSLDRRKFLQSIPRLQKMRVLNPRIKPAEINLEPVFFSVSFLATIIPAATHEFYQDNPGADKCSFSATLLTTDHDGTVKPVPAFTYDFDRALDRSVNWRNFDSDQFPRLAPNFTFAPAAVTQAQEERRAADLTRDDNDDDDDDD